MSWDYAELSKLAKENGGPEALVDSLISAGKEEGYSEGQSSMVPVILGVGGLCLAAGVGLPALIKKLARFFNSKKNQPEELEAAKEELIQGIKEYDASHPDSDEETNTDGVVQTVG